MGKTRRKFKVIPGNNKYSVLRSKRYCLPEVDREINGYTIKALRSFGNIKKGDVGGFIQTTKNLSTDPLSKCWVGVDCAVIGDAKVVDDAKIKTGSIVSGNAVVSDYAVVCKDSTIGGSAKIKERSIVSSSCVIDSNVSRYGRVLFGSEVTGVYSEISDFANVYSSKVMGGAQIKGSAKISAFCVIDGVNVTGKTKMMCLNVKGNYTIGRSPAVRFFKHPDFEGVNYMCIFSDEFVIIRSLSMQFNSITIDVVNDWFKPPINCDLEKINKEAVSWWYKRGLERVQYTLSEYKKRDCIRDSDCRKNLFESVTDGIRSRSTDAKEEEEELRTYVSNCCSSS